jgi:hypothetical protein
MNTDEEWMEDGTHTKARRHEEERKEAGCWFWPLSFVSSCLRASID